MAKKTVSEIKSLSQNLFSKQSIMLPLYQTLADNFYPERADFTAIRNAGAELADRNVSSYPILARRDLCNSFSAMLRDGEWFNVGVDGDTDHLGKMWLQFATKKLKKAVDNRAANFVRATKEGDHDYGTFGQCVISCEPNRMRNGLLFRNWHLRDCAWQDGPNGQVDTVARKWRPTLFELCQYFGENVHSKILEDKKQNPFQDADVVHIVMPSALYDDEQITEQFDYVSIFIDMQNEHIMEVSPLKRQYYTVPRFQTVAGSPYAYSPATVAALPDARTLQAMTFTLLEAGERYARPPLIATQNVVRGDVDLSPDGVTYLDKDYDEKLGAALRPLQQDRGGFPIGLQMRNDIVEVINSAFYLDKLNLPDVSREMTAYEVQERMKQFRRENLPLFAPLESEYNGALCESAFSTAMDLGLLGSPYDIPESLQERDILFQFESPLRSSDEEKKATQFQQTAQLLEQAAKFDPSAVANINFDVALREAITGTGSPVTWLNSMDQVLQRREQDQMQQTAAMAMEAGAQ